MSKKKAESKVPRMFVITQKVIDRAGELAGQGFSAENIARYYGVSKSIFYDRMAENAELKDAVENGKIRTVSMVASKLMEHIKKGSLPAIQFYLARQGYLAGYCEPPNNPNAPKPQVSLSLNVTDPIEAAKIYQSIMGGGSTSE